MAGRGSRGDVSDRPLISVIASKICIFLLASLTISSLAQTPPQEDKPLPSQAKPIEGILVPVPKEIFSTLDQFRNVNWRAVQRPEVVRWKSHGDQTQIALLLGVVVAEGFVAMEAEDSTEVKNVGNAVLKLARGLGVEEIALRRSRSIIDDAERNEWTAARKEWDGVLSDLENGMIALRSEQLSQLVSISGWLRGTEALCVLVLQDYSPEKAALIREPALIERLENQLRGMSSKTRNDRIVIKLSQGMKNIHSLVDSENGAITEKTVRNIQQICAELVSMSSRRPK